MEKCPYCSGDIPAGAKKCKHCGEWLKENKRGISIVWKIILAVFLVIVVLLLVDTYNSTQETMHNLGGNSELIR